MSYERRTFTITTDANGDGSFTTDFIHGLLYSIVYVKDDYTDGVDFTIITVETARTLWTESNVNASKIVSPRTPVHDTVGVANEYIAATGEAVLDKILLADETITFTVAAGGDSKSGTFHILYQG